MTITNLGGKLTARLHDGSSTDVVYGVDADGAYLGVVRQANAVDAATGPPPRGEWRWRNGAWKAHKLPGQRKLEIEQARDEGLADGVGWAGRRWYADATFQQHLLGCLAAFSEGVVPVDATFPVRAKDKVVYPLNRLEIRQLSAAVLAYVQAQFVASWAEKAKIGQ